MIDFAIPSSGSNLNSTAVTPLAGSTTDLRSLSAGSPPSSPNSSDPTSASDLAQHEGEADAPALSDDDLQQLAKFDELRNMLADRARTVAHGFQNGAYIVGPPGTGKTYTVSKVLEGMKANFIVKNAKMTAPGLWELLNDNREKTIVLDDIPSLAAERAALQILMAGLGGKPGEPRLITYTSAEVDKGRRSFEFRGGIIAVSNVPLRQDPLAKAVASRVPLLHHNPTDDMLIAFMRQQAIKGYKDLSAVEALETVEFAIAELRAAESRVDLRVMPKALEDRRFWADHATATHWKELVRSSIKFLATPVDQPVTRDATKEKERRIAQDLFRNFPLPQDAMKRDEEWKRLTGKSVDTLLRHGRALRGLGAA